MPRPMKALTVWQPWASLIVLGIKTIETRSWRLPDSMVGQRIAIHAAAHKLTRREIDEINKWWNVDDAPVMLSNDGAELWWRSFEDPAFKPGAWTQANIRRIRLPLGAIVGHATLGEDLPTYSDDMPSTWVDEDVPAIEYGYGAGDEPCLIRWQRDDSEGIDITNQLPYGDFTPGRHGWPLTNPEPCDPIPAKGRLGFWDWEAA